MNVATIRNHYIRRRHSNPQSCCGHVDSLRCHRSAAVGLSCQRHLIATRISGSAAGDVAILTLSSLLVTVSLMSLLARIKLGWRRFGGLLKS